MTAPLVTPIRDALTESLHRHVCGTDYDQWNQPCSWAGDDWDYENGPATCAYVGEIGVESAVLAWVATLADDKALVERVAAHYGAERTRITRTVLRALAAALTERVAP